MSEKWILVDGRPKVCRDLMEWAKWYETAERRVGEDAVNDAYVSTVFLGLDHQFGDGPPLLFETMIFGGKHDEYQERCSTLEEAKAMHKRAVNMVTTQNATEGDFRQKDAQELLREEIASNLNPRGNLSWDATDS